MEQKEIVTSIQIMNELIRQDFLKFKQINININFFKELINNKKLLKLNDAFDSETENKQKKIDKHIYSSDVSTEISINDSIAVTNFTIPTSIYNDDSKETMTNTSKKSKYKFSNSNTTQNSIVSI